MQEYPVGRIRRFLLTYPRNLLEFVPVFPGPLLYVPCHIQDGPLTHSVNEVICLALHKYRREKLVLPVIVVGKTPQGGLYSSNYNRGVGIQFLEDIGIHLYGIVGPHVWCTVGGIGIIAA